MNQVDFQTSCVSNCEKFTPGQLCDYDWSYFSVMQIALILGSANIASVAHINIGITMNLKMSGWEYSHGIFFFPWPKEGNLTVT